MWRSMLAGCFFIAFPVFGISPPEFSYSAVPFYESPQVSMGDGAQVPAAPPAPIASTHPPQRTSPKVHKWSGSLVDAGCMANALRQIPCLDQMISPEPLAQYHLQGIEDSQPTPQGAGAGTTPTQAPTHPPSQPPEARGSNGEAETSERELAMQAAQLRRAELEEQKVKMCTPRQPTTHFGLVVSGEHLLKFDSGGDFKAMSALKASVIQPGKPVKAKVTGEMLEAENIITVTSIEIKSQIQPSQAALDSGAIFIMSNGGPSFL